MSPEYLSDDGRGGNRMSETALSYRDGRWLADGRPVNLERADAASMVAGEELVYREFMPSPNSNNLKVLAAVKVTRPLNGTWCWARVTAVWINDGATTGDIQLGQVHLLDPRRFYRICPQ